MPSLTPAERLLSWEIGPDRAAAIMGDLEELAATRSRLWFWTMYLRALISLGWRTGPAAFVLSFVCLRALFGKVLPWLMYHRTPQLMEPGLFPIGNPHLRALCWNLSLVTAQFLAFALPFVLIRFGPRERLSRLTSALAIVAMPVYSLRPWLMDLSGLATLLILTAALLVAAWRKPLAILAVTCAGAVCLKVPFFILPLIVSRHVNRQIPRIPAGWGPAADLITFAAAAILCVLLHRRLLSRGADEDATIV